MLSKKISRRAKTAGDRLQDAGQFTKDGWQVKSTTTQLKYDLGRFYKKGRVELEVRGPLNQQKKHSLFSAWNEEAAEDADRKTQSFFQLRVMNSGMMLRLTNRSGGRSFEGRTPPLDWDDQHWYRIEGSWDTDGGVNTLVRDGQKLREGKFNASFEGFRWVFIGKDNYQNFLSIPGLTYRRLKVCVE